ncbi:MAG: Uma2 family endonuclease [Hyphomonadaceae bacterium]|jgi:Uma2 family endonuclease|nr:Uma2 family endonuclease [Hyphomonadaceae bacterium]
MNEHLRPATLPGTTQAAEGLPRRRWSVAEIREMMAKGIILEEERFELIGGEVVPMSPKGNRHEIVKQALQQYWFPLTVGTPASLITETTLYISDDEFREPDFLFWPRSISLKDVTAASSLFIVEVADSSLGYDLGTKAKAYAALGLPELWVINANTLVTTLHRKPAQSAYADTCDAGPSELLEPLHAPQLAVRLTDLGLTPAT